MPSYKIPVVYKVYSFCDIEGDSLLDALEKFSHGSATPNFTPPTSEGYVEDSLEITEQEIADANHPDLTEGDLEDLSTFIQEFYRYK